MEFTVGRFDLVATTASGKRNSPASPIPNSRACLGARIETSRPVVFGTPGATPRRPVGALRRSPALSGALRRSPALSGADLRTFPQYCGRYQFPASMPLKARSRYYCVLLDGKSGSVAGFLELVPR